MPVSELLLNVFFYVFAAAALGGGAAVALSRNIVRSAFALLTVLFAVAALYAFARADFIVVAQILIYVGGILVLIIFAIMLTHKITDVKVSNESSPGPASIGACACLFVLLVAAFVYGHRWDLSPKPQPGVFLAVGTRADMAAELSMTQGDGKVGIPPGKTVLDGFVRLHASIRVPATRRALARFVVSKYDANEKDPARRWKELPERKYTYLTPTPRGGAMASADFERLEEGKYRWKVRLEDEEGESPWVAFGAQGLMDEADFDVEKGLTRALGRAFMGPYLLAFEVVSVLLLAALVGAAYLARKEVKE
jgi:NADH:ubiquinone oxidoreductase subunit 6 (subunit J)